jgi:N6-L-threonylcarbamoyladenine synthase
MPGPLSSTSRKRPAVAAAGAQRHLAARRGVVERVVEQVRRELAEELGLAFDRRRLELLEGERLDEVVVGAEVETADAVGHRVVRGDDDDGEVALGAAQAPRPLEAVDPRQPDVEDDEVEGLVLDREQRALGALDAVDRIARVAQAPGEPVGEHGVVFDDEQAHGGTEMLVVPTGISYPPPMLVLGIETSCDDTGVALYDSARGLLAHEVHSQAALHADYGGVVPELASRDHIRRTLPLLERVLARAGARLVDVDAVAYTEGPGLAGALLVGASIAAGIAYGLGVPVLGIHHLEGHLLSPLLSARPPAFPFIALLVSGGHTQLMEVKDAGRYAVLGETLDDAAGEAFDKTAQLLGLGYPGGPALARLAEGGRPGRFTLPRPMIASGDLDFSFSGLKTAVATLARSRRLDEAARADLAAEFQEAIVDVLVAKCGAALAATGHRRLVVAGGVGANRRLRERLDAAAAQGGFDAFYPELELCTDNGAMIAYAAARRLAARDRSAEPGYGFTVRPRWELAELTA